MIESFAVANFRSFAARQCMSLEPAALRGERGGAVSLGTTVKSPRLLRVAAILGANASGKSSFILALDFLQTFIASSAQSTQLGDKIPVTPFMLDEDFRGKPSCFEINFCFEGKSYSYTLELTARRVHLEGLSAKSLKGQFREIFSRKLEGDEEVWSLGELPPEQANLWRQSTRPNASFLSTAVQLNSVDLAKPFEWLTEKLHVETTRDNFSSTLTSHLIKDHVDDGCRADVMNILRQADLGIRDVEIQEEEFDATTIPEMIPDEVRTSMVEALKGKKRLSALVKHRARSGAEVVFDLTEESDGTQRLYEMIGPWVMALRHNLTLVVDEIDSSLHPLIVRMLVTMFQEPREDECKSQLIFATHDDGLLDSEILERDQFWFIEKRRGASRLIPLLEYGPRKGEALRRNYLRGRYGGIPALAHVSRES